MHSELTVYHASHSHNAIFSVCGTRGPVVHSMVSTSCQFAGRWHLALVGDMCAMAQLTFEVDISRMLRSQMFSLLAVCCR